MNHLHLPKFSDEPTINDRIISHHETIIGSLSINQPVNQHQVIIHHRTFIQSSSNQHENHHSTIIPCKPPSNHPPTIIETIIQHPQPSSNHQGISKLQNHHLSIIKSANKSPPQPGRNPTTAIPFVISDAQPPTVETRLQPAMGHPTMAIAPWRHGLPGEALRRSLPRASQGCHGGGCRGVPRGVASWGGILGAWED